MDHIKGLLQIRIMQFGNAWSLGRPDKADPRRLERKNCLDKGSDDIALCSIRL